MEVHSLLTDCAVWCALIKQLKTILEKVIRSAQISVHNKKKPSTLRTRINL